jgi:hypothetical protein
LLKQKVAQNVAISLGYFIYEPPKVAQLAKMAQSGHPEQNRIGSILHCVTQGCQGKY